MLSVRIQEDCFFLASLPAEKAKELCPPPLVPVITGTYGWMSVAAVRFTNVRLFGCPVTRTATCAASMLLAEYRETSGLLCRGNLFLKGFTTSRSLHRARQLLGLHLFQYTSLRLRGDEQAIELDIPNYFCARIERKQPISKDRQRRMEDLFRENRHAFVQRRGQVWRVDIEKSHWEMRGREARLLEARLFAEPGAEFQFAFDTSDATGRWLLPRRIHFSKTDSPSPIACALFAGLGREITPKKFLPTLPVA